MMPTVVITTGRPQKVMGVSQATAVPSEPVRGNTSDVSEKRRSRPLTMAAKPSRNSEQPASLTQGFLCTKRRRYKPSSRYPKNPLT